ncbi:CD225/dispanin family protein, partial [Frankia sp. CcWB3]
MTTPPSGPPPGYGQGQPGGYPPYPPGGFGQQPPYGQPIPTYLWQSIVATLLCCLPAGIVAIVFASQVQGRQQSGDVAGALGPGW